MPAYNIHDLGDLVRCTGTFTTDGTTVHDPTVVKFSFQKPGGATVTYTYLTDVELVRDSEGVYHVDLNADTAGQWYYRF